MDSYLALEKTLLLVCADLAIIVAAARVSGWLIGKIGQPPVVGEILAGAFSRRPPSSGWSRWLSSRP